jgi:hypothetical protein
MPVYSYLFLLIIASIIILFILFFVLRKKSIPVELYIEALRSENNGHFEAAAITYQIAYNEAKKIRFHGTLKNKIIQKLKLLHTVVEYNKNLHFTRLDN